jgi:hypothetical protein
MSRRGVALAVLALLGVALTVALTWSIGRITGQHIGLAAAPPSVIRGLAPSSAAHTERPDSEPRPRAGDWPQAATHRTESSVTVTQANNSAITSSPQKGGEASGNGDGRNGSGGPGGEGGPGGSPRSGGSRRDD